MLVLSRPYSERLPSLGRCAVVPRLVDTSPGRGLPDGLPAPARSEDDFPRSPHVLDDKPWSNTPDVLFCTSGRLLFLDTTRKGICVFSLRQYLRRYHSRVIPQNNNIPYITPFLRLAATVHIQRNEHLLHTAGMSLPDSRSICTPLAQVCIQLL